MSTVTDAASGTATAGAGPSLRLPGPQTIEKLVAGVVCAPRPATAQLRTPLTGEPLATVPLSSTGDVAVAVQAAAAAQRGWSRIPAARRAQVFLRLHDLVLEHQSELLDLVQLESGKARRHAFEEIMDVAVVSRHYGRRGPAYLRPRRRPGALPLLTEAVQLRHPLGVVGIVSPWNYPLSLAVTDAIPALVAGNAVVLRPDLQGSLTALRVVQLLAEAGLPERVLQVVLGDGPTVGAAVLEGADQMVFTGSTATGRLLARDAGSRLQPASLEMGGKNAMYVAADADLGRAVEGALRACFSSAGQLCVSTERLLLHEGIADAFLDRFLPAVRGMRLGAALAYGPDLGSLGSAEQLDRVSRHVEDAQGKGATVLAGGRARPDVGPYFYEPTVLTGVTDAMQCATQETFGPVVSIRRVRDDAEAVRVANEGDYGLQACIWTRDWRRGRVLASAVQAGSVSINEGYAATWGSVSAPIGGVKNSGHGPGRHGAEGLLRHTRSQTVATQHLVGLGPPEGVTDEGYARLMTGVLRVLKRLTLG